MFKGTSLHQVRARLNHLLHTLFLFMRSDVPLVVAPSLLCGLVLAGPTDLSSFAAACVWQNLHLLAFNVRYSSFDRVPYAHRPSFLSRQIQNQVSCSSEDVKSDTYFNDKCVQIAGVEEDRLCKPYRPLASGRISLEDGRKLYLVVVGACLAWSSLHDLLPLSVIYSCGTWLYNEFELAANPFLKTPMCGVAYLCYVGGATFIIGHHETLSSSSLHAIMVSGLIFGLTGHMQDFRDRSGDALMGRRTIPLILPQRVARWSLLLIISCFTCGLIWLWSPPVLVSFIFVFLSLTTVTTLVATHSEEADRVNFHWYEGWLICAHLLPLFRRISDGEIVLPGTSTSFFPRH
ncbi:hypothetical protein PM082_008525 [Marasmius tenuissimus]|nr:hypothetical protein PM082_008525 [Marasmius tenuissimus]